MRIASSMMFIAIAGSLVLWALAAAQSYSLGVSIIFAAPLALMMLFSSNDFNIISAIGYTVSFILVTAWWPLVGMSTRLATSERRRNVFFMLMVFYYSSLVIVLCHSNNVELLLFPNPLQLSWLVAFIFWQYLLWNSWLHDHPHTTDRGSYNILTRR